MFPSRYILNQPEDRESITLDHRCLIPSRVIPFQVMNRVMLILPMTTGSPQRSLPLTSFVVSPPSADIPLL